MFYDTRIQIWSGLDETTFVKEIEGDVQPYVKTIAFEDGYELEVTKRVFCDRDEAITKNGCLIIEGVKYKILKMKVWSDYVEILLYACKRQ
ncbi:hypothetical protein [Aneurinibacillus aneurinilyticus]|jgi:hypothetical protein|uniref:hypothetical protein n=1 Tax=Aneurinibacillus aneurinilyticus TaxID=1391 RepID=UPI0023F90D50|nr:hypothetical protein [Aneurinibacillus aneurinilyticus]MCI1693308.1 hypothetical protein [Aneurinibacillus aneurinilyticus]